LIVAVERFMGEQAAKGAKHDLPCSSRKRRSQNLQVFAKLEFWLRQRLKLSDTYPVRTENSIPGRRSKRTA
jgi:hypothetical protein